MLKELVITFHFLTTPTPADVIKTIPAYIPGYSACQCSMVKPEYAKASAHEEYVYCYMTELKTDLEYGVSISATKQIQKFDQMEISKMIVELCRILENHIRELTG